MRWPTAFKRRDTTQELVNLVPIAVEVLRQQFGDPLKEGTQAHGMATRIVETQGVLARVHQAPLLKSDYCHVHNTKQQTYADRSTWNHLVLIVAEAARGLKDGAISEQDAKNTIANHLALKYLPYPIQLAMQINAHGIVRIPQHSDASFKELPDHVTDADTLYADNMVRSLQSRMKAQSPLLR